MFLRFSIICALFIIFEIYDLLQSINRKKHLIISYKIIFSIPMKKHYIFSIQKIQNYALSGMSVNQK